MREQPGGQTLKDLVRANDISGIGSGIGSLMDLDAYHNLHPEYNGHAMAASLLVRLGLPSLEEKTWGKNIAFEVFSPYIMQVQPDVMGDSWLERHRPQIMIAGLLKSTTDLVGGKPRMYVFADDVHVDKDFGDATFVQELVLPGLVVITHVEKGRTVGSLGSPQGDTRSYDGVIFESRYRDEGARLIEILENSYPERIKGGKRKRLKGLKGEQDVYFWEKDKDGNDTKDPSCDVLDLAHKIHISQVHDGTVILIPQSYRKQQERVLQLESLLGQSQGSSIDNVVVALTPSPPGEPQAT
ncbi:MAG TPA: hypothetical protein VM077_00070 [Candidatus Limnocylindrales bacterium]|nr:hypothetical protein [Candidatus Limnocylindrales bacterium]